MQILCKTGSGGSKNFEKKGGRKTIFISSVLSYRKCAQRNICLLHGKERLIEKKIGANGGGGGPRSHPFESATERECGRHKHPKQRLKHSSLLDVTNRASKGTPSDAKCVTEVLGWNGGGQNKEVAEGKFYRFVSTENMCTKSSKRSTTCVDVCV